MLNLLKGFVLEFQYKLCNVSCWTAEMAIMPGADMKGCDHPLSDGPESAWSTFFKDNEFLLQIDKDVRRLCPDISFFQQVVQL